METDFRNDAPEGYFLTTGDHKKKTFQTEYELLESIGVGSFSEVKKCRHRHTGNGIRVQKDTKSLSSPILYLSDMRWTFNNYVIKSDSITYLQENCMQWKYQNEIQLASKLEWGTMKFRF